MGIKNVDLTGTRRSDEDLQDAIDVISKLMVKPPMEYPELAVNLMSIRELLAELQALRKVIQDAQKGG